MSAGAPSHIDPSHIDSSSPYGSGTPDLDRGDAAQPRRTALDRPAQVGAARAPRVDAEGEPRRRPSANLWRLRHYLTPFRTCYAVMVALAALGVGATIVVPLVTRAVIDGPVADGNRSGLLRLGLLAVLLGGLEALLIFARRWVVAAATNGTELAIRTDLYAKLQRLPMAFHTGWDSGQLLSRIMNDLATIRRFLGFGLIFLLTSIVQIAVTVALLLHLYWPLGLLVLVSVVPIVVICLRVEREYTKLSRRVQDQTGDVASTVEEGAYGLRVIKSFGRAEHMFATFDTRATRLSRPRWCGSG